MSEDRLIGLDGFRPRSVDADLRAEYRRAGFWDGATLPAVLFDGLERHADQQFRIWSRSHPYSGTFEDLRQMALRVASGLRRRGIGPGDVVAFQLPNWVEAAALFYGLSALGAAILPIVHSYGPREVRFVLRQSRARVLVVPSRFGRRDHAAEVEALRPDLPDLEHVIVVGSDGAEGTTSFESLVDADPLESHAPLDPEAVAVIGFTSGTSAAPKGAVHTHESICAEARFHMATTGSPRPTLLGSPVSHVTGMLVGLLVPPITGRPVHLVDVWDPAHVLEIMLEGRLSAGTGATVFVNSLLDHPALTPAHVDLIGGIAVGGSPVRLADVERWESLGITVTRGYGCTEHPSISTALESDPRQQRNRCDGRLRPGVEVRIVDDRGREVPAGGTGEIQSRGPDLFAGYLDERLTDEAFAGGGWFATGDVGGIDDEGWITIIDRTKDIIIRGGENISAAEVEELLTAMDVVAEAVVVAAPDARMGERAAAFLRLRPGAPAPDLEVVRRHLDGAGLARLKWPEELHVVEDFPRTASGKVQKFVLREELRRPTLG